MGEPDLGRSSAKTPPSVQFEKILSQMLQGSSESVKQVERVLSTPDSQTSITYEVQVDSGSGKQKVIERFTTTKRECAICTASFSQVFECADCGARVCAADSRHHSWGVWVDAWGVPKAFDSKIAKSLTYEMKSKTVCKSCAINYGIKG